MIRQSFIVVKKGESLTEDNIRENVFTVTNTKEEAESWIEKHSVKVPVYEDGENKGYKAKYIKSKIEDYLVISELPIKMMVMHTY